MPAARKPPRRLRLEPARRHLTAILADLAGHHDLSVQDLIELLSQQQLTYADRLQQTSTRRGS